MLFRSPCSVGVHITAIGYEGSCEGIPLWLAYVEVALAEIPGFANCDRAHETINLAELSRRIDESCEVGKNEHGHAYNAGDAKKSALGGLIIQS